MEHIFNNSEALSAGEEKIREYAQRIIDGESYEDIATGLGPAMTTGIVNELEKRGYGNPANLEASDEADIAIETTKEVETNDSLTAYVEEIVANRSAAVRDLYEDLLAHKDDPEKRKLLTTALVGDEYRKLRTSEYASDPEEEATWEWAKNTRDIDIVEQNNWMYRGTFPSSDETTTARGSFNVDVTPELISALDNYISSGAIRANYKFGNPNTPASPVERHDSISIYFLDTPSQEVLDEISSIVAPYARGDNLLGKKVSEGFYISEIGSIQEKHIEPFLEQLDGIDPSFAEGIRFQITHTDRLAMSEAEFYAIQKVAAEFGYAISYESDTGFLVKLNHN